MGKILVVCQCISESEKFSSVAPFPQPLSVFPPFRRKVSTGAFAHVNVFFMLFSTCVSSVCLFLFFSLFPIFLCSNKHPLVQHPLPNSRYAQKDNEMKKRRKYLKCGSKFTFLSFFLYFLLRCWGCNFELFFVV